MLIIWYALVYVLEVPPFMRLNLRDLGENGLF